MRPPSRSFSGPACGALLLVLFCLSTAQAVTEQRAGQPINRDATQPSAQSQGSAAAGSSRESFDLDAGRVLVATGGVIALIFMLRWGGKKMLPAALGGASAGAVMVLARCPLGHRQQIILLQIGKRVIVAADCASQLTSLCQITDADEVAALLGALKQEKASPASAFSAWFTQARQAFGGDDLEKQTALPADDNADIEPPETKAAASHSSPPDDRLHDLTARVRDLARRFGGPGRPA